MSESFIGSGAEGDQIEGSRILRTSPLTPGATCNAARGRQYFQEIQQNQCSRRKVMMMSVPELVLLEDEPIDDEGLDELGLLPFASVIAGAALGTRGPFTIGVFADWGQGKTSVLRQTRNLIRQTDDQTVTVWFNAWQYEREEHPIVPLVATLVRGLELYLNQNGSVIEAGVKALLRALRAVAYGFSATAKIAVPGFGEVESGFVAKEMIDRYDKLSTASDPLLDRSLYYHAFESLSNAVATNETPKLVVFIDDLDRCLPDQGLKLLESIKLILSQPGFIFVLGVDRRVIEGYLRKRYRDDFGMEDYDASGTSYLDKIVQLPMALPSHQGRFAAYVERLLDRQMFDTESNRHVKKAVYSLIPLLSAGSAYNPRSLVRFFNNLIVDSAIWSAMQKAMTEEDVALCAVSRILRQHLGERLYRSLVRNRELCERLASGPRGASANEIGPSGRSDQRMVEIQSRLSASDSIGDLLAIPEVSLWLRAHDKRIEVNEFLLSQREDIVTQPDKSRARLYALTKDIPEGSYLILKNGVLIKNVAELAATLDRFEDDVFNSHKDDLLRWIRDVFEDEALAAKLETLDPDKKQYQLAIYRHMAGHD